MKRNLVLTLLMIVSFFGCKNQKEGAKENGSNEVTVEKQSVEPNIEKVFEDEIIIARFIVTDFRDDFVEGEIEITNKTSNKIKFDFKNFVFNCGNQLGKLPIVEITQTAASIPDLTGLTENEKEEVLRKRKEEFISNSNKRAYEREKYFYLVNSEISLSSIEKTTKRIELNFDDKIEVEKIEIYFNGEYKKLLKM